MRAARFCLITTFYPPFHFGGDAVGVQRLARALVRRGHDVTVIHDADAHAVLASGPPPTATATAGERVITLRSRLPMLSTLLTQQTGHPIVNGRQIRRILDEGRFDVIVFNNVSLVGGPGLLSYGGPAVKIYVAHEHWLVCPTHVLWRHGRERCDRRECVRCQLRHRRLPQLWRHTGFLERELDHVDAFIAMSEFSRAKHHEFGFPREMDVIPHFLPDEDRPAVAGADDRPHARPYFLFVGRLEAIKGLDQVIPLFHTYRDADLVVAGDGTQGPALRSLAAGDTSVRFLGHTSPADLARYYRHAVAVIVPSVCYETFGMILIEAFRHGTPVLARRLGPFPEIVERSGGGELFASSEELLASMGRVQHDAGRRARLSRAGTAALHDVWSEAAVVPQYLDVIRRIASRRGLTDVVAALEPAAAGRDGATSVGSHAAAGTRV